MHAHQLPLTYPEAPGHKEKGGTSKEAAKKVEKSGRAATLRTSVLAQYLRGDWTADEVAENLGESVLSIRPRVSELLAAGKLRKTRERRKNASGSSAAVYSYILNTKEDPNEQTN